MISTVRRLAAIPTLLSVAIVSPPAPAHAQSAGCAQVEVHNVRPDAGLLMIAAYAAAADFGSRPVVALQITATSETMTFPLCGLGDSAALTLFQDLNGNSKLDRNVVGIPSEPWGASGKPSAMSAPTWETTRVPLDGTPIVVRLSR